MPVITMDRKDLEKLTGRKLSNDILEDRLPMLGSELEKIDGNELAFEFFPNRPDLLSTEGVARALRTFLGVKKGPAKYVLMKSNYKVVVSDELKNIRPFIACAVVKNIKFTDEFIKSVMQLQEKLHITHGRKRKKAAIGIYDLSKIKFPVYYSTISGSGISFVPLDFTQEMTPSQILKEHPKGIEYSWTVSEKNKYPLLTDSRNNVLSMPPIINSDTTKVTEKTREIFIDVTGTDLKTVNQTLNIIATAFAERGAKLFGVKIAYPGKKTVSPEIEPVKMSLNISYVNKVLGTAFSAKQVSELLMKMGFGAVQKANNISVLVPCYRTDILHEFDLVEDVAIAYGYENFSPSMPVIFHPSSEEKIEIFSKKIRGIMANLGCLEVMSFILTNQEKLFSKMNQEHRQVALIENPKTSDFTVVRDTLIPCLMEVFSNNTHNELPQSIFEADDAVVLDSSADTGAKTSRKLAFARTAEKSDFTDAKSVLDTLLLSLGLNSELLSFEDPSFVPGRCALIKIKNKEIGIIGEIHPEIILNWGFKSPVSCFEIDLDELMKLVGP